MLGISGAQEEATSLDILVCGTCHVVFHFVEDFKEHKAKKECDKTAVRSTPCVRNSHSCVLVKKTRFLLLFYIVAVSVKKNIRSMLW